MIFKQNLEISAILLAYVSVGDRAKDIERLVSALAEIRRNL